jgi:hypothetical protein
MARPRTQPTTAEIERFAEGIQSVDKLDPWVKILVYGDTGSGKTRFAASAPKVLIIDVREKGTRSAIGSRAHKREVGTFDQIGLAYWYLKAGNHPYKTVAIDTVTAMHSAAMDKVMKEAENRDPTREKSQPSQQVYGRANKLVEGMLLAFRNLPMHVIFLAQERKEKDEEGDVREITIALPEGARGPAAGCVGIIGHIRPKRVGGKWVDELFTGNSRLYKTKERTHELKAVIRKPTMPDIIRSWNRSRTNAT